MDIEDWRQKIDEVDEQVVLLLNQRASAALEIGKLKKQAGRPIYEPGREGVVFEKIRKANRGPLQGDQLEQIYHRIIDVMRTLQRNDS
jgi:chorismate mutase